MAQVISLADKLALLNTNYVRPVIVTSKNNPPNLCACCGSISLKLIETIPKTYGNRIVARWVGLESDVPMLTQTDALLIPDETGNLLLTWDDV